MPKNLIDEVVSASPNRRRFLKTLGAATAGVTAMSMTGLKPAQAQTSTEIEVLQFALNLEYLEAEFYSYALSGKGIESFGIGTDGQANGQNPAGGGTTTGGSQVSFTDSATYDTWQTGYDIANDERAHVTLLRTALGTARIAKPNINLNALGFGFQSQNYFLILARIFEDIGVSAYAGGAGLLTTPAVITTAARILAAEAEHVSAIRLQIALYQLLASPIDAVDLVPPPYGSTHQLFSMNTVNGLVATRTPGQVLYLAFGNQAGATSGGFFPSGVNGAITTSTAAAPATNLNT
jgi:hypothetical protein